MNISERILALRKASGMSQEELADQIGVSRQAVSKWEAGQSQPDLDKVMALSKFFGVPTDYLLMGDQASPAAVPPAEPQRPIGMKQSTRAFWIAFGLDLAILAAGLLLVFVVFPPRSMAFLCIMVLCFMCFVWIATYAGVAGNEIAESEGKQAGKSFSCRFWRWTIWIFMVPVCLLVNFMLDFEPFGPTWGAGFVLYLVVCIPVSLVSLLDE